MANSELRLQIEHLETNQAFHRGVRRFWALLYYTFEKTLITKAFFAKNYVLLRQARMVDNKGV